MRNQDFRDTMDAIDLWCLAPERWESGSSELEAETARCEQFLRDAVAERHPVYDTDDLILFAMFHDDGTRKGIEVRLADGVTEVRTFIGPWGSRRVH